MYRAARLILRALVRSSRVSLVLFYLAALLAVLLAAWVQTEEAREGRLGQYLFYASLILVYWAMVFEILAIQAVAVTLVSAGTVGVWGFIRLFLRPWKCTTEARKAVSCGSFDAWLAEKRWGRLAALALVLEALWFIGVFYVQFVIGGFATELIA